MKQYLETLKKIAEEGQLCPDRTGTGRIRIFGTQQRYNLKDGFPLVTTRKIFTKAFIHELLWFIKGSTNISYLKDNNVNIWNLWAVKDTDIDSFIHEFLETDEEPIKEEIKTAVKQNLANYIDNIGPMYGAMWRNAPKLVLSSDIEPKIKYDDIASDKKALFKANYEKLVNEGNAPKYGDDTGEVASLEDYSIHRYLQTVDQLNDLVINLKRDPFGARHVVTAWVPEFVPFYGVSPQHNVLLRRGSLAACHCMFQFFALPGDNPGDKPKLSLQMYQRSCDYPVGNPMNIAQYALLLAMVAQVVDMEAYEFIHATGDTHIYADQMELVKEQLTRKPLPLPKLWLNPEVKDLFAFTADDIKILDYQHHDKLNYPVSM